MSRLPPKQCHPLLLRFLLNWSAGETADALRIGHRRSEKRAVKGLHQLIRQLRKEKLLIQEEALSAALETRATAVPLPPDLADGILSAAPDCFGRRPKLALARSTLRAMSWAACKGRLKIAGAILGALIVLVAALALSAGLLWHSGWALPWLIEFGARRQVKEMPEMAQPVRPWANPGWAGC
jgi:hypothetical protein